LGSLAFLLFMIGDVFNGIAIAASDRMPRWAGWVYAISEVGFLLSTFLLDIGQSIFSALLFIAVVAVAWSAAREPQRQAQGDVGVAN
jgi:phosphotransferase system  glucose/maltose/N-acetylglucosamine-specific IIC component